MIVICLEGCHGSGKSSLCEQFRRAGVKILDEGFLDMPETPLHPQTLTMETLWMSRWFERLLKEKNSLGEEEQHHVYIADRSPYSAVFYSQHNGHLLEPLIDAQKTELLKAGIIVVTVYLKVKDEVLWERIRARLAREPYRKRYNEGSREWMETTLQFYNCTERNWDYVIANNKETLLEVMANLNNILASDLPEFQRCCPKLENVRSPQVSPVKSC